MERRSADDESQSTPAPKEDQIEGSEKNSPGSAKNASGGIEVSDPVRKSLQAKVISHNAEMRKGGRPKWTKASLGQLLAVYRRGAGAYSTSHRPDVSRAAWAMARVNAYLFLLRSGHPRDAKYVTDNDLLPSGHPKKSESREDTPSLLEFRARIGRAGKKKRPKMGSPRAPAKMGGFAGCGTGAGGFKPGNRCGKEDGIPNKPVYLGRKGFAQVGEKPIKIDRAKLKEQIAAGKAKAEVKQKAKMAEDRRKSIQIKRQKAAVRKAAKDKAEAEAAIAQEAAQKAARKAKLIAIKRKKAAERKKAKEEAERLAAQKEAEAKAAKKAEMLKKIRMKNASKKLVIASTPKSIADEIKELKFAKGNAQLNVVGTPPSIEEQIADAKIAAAINPPPAFPLSETVVETARKRAQSASPIKNGNVGAVQQKAGIKTLDEMEQQRNEKEWLFGPRYGQSTTHQERVDTKQAIGASIAKRMGDAGVKESDITDEALEWFGKVYLTTGGARRIPPEVPAEYHRRYAFACGMVDSWAQTSGDHNWGAVGVQFAIADEFKVSGAYTRHMGHSSKHPASKLFPKGTFQEKVQRVRAHPAVRAAVRAQYDITQDYLKELGITEFTITRGYSSSAKPGDAASGFERSVKLQPASSFSTSKQTSGAFTGSKASKRRMITATIKADRVFSTCVTGFGCLSEEEIVILGGSLKGRVEKW